MMAKYGDTVMQPNDARNAMSAKLLSIHKYRIQIQCVTFALQY